MKHYGDITQIHGDAVEIVDIVTGGSPCQDLSVAGKRAGLDGERSGLFMEQIRIVKEMREHYVRTTGRADGSVRPRYMVWENVPGAFSSNQGKDFQAVLTEIARIVEPDAPDVPMPDKGRWAKAGCLYGELGTWSIAWRVHDAQFWGVPQRRKRIALVADFGGLSAPEILFERKGMSGNTSESGKERESAAADVRSGIEETSRAVSFQERAGKSGGGKGILIQNERTGALSTLNNQSVVYGISAYDSNSMKSGNPNSGIYEAETARTLDLNGGSPACNQGGMAVVYNGAGITSPINASNPKPGDPCHTLTDDSRNYLVQGADMYNGALTGDIAATLNATSGDSPTHSGASVVCLEGNGSRPSHRGDGYSESETMYTLNSTEHHAVAVENHPADSRVKISEDGMVQTLSGRMGTGGGNVPMIMEPYVAQNWDGDDVAPTLTANNAGGGQRMPDKGNFNAVVQSMETYHCTSESDVAQTMKARDYKDPQCIAYGLDRAAYNQGANAQFDFSCEEDRIGALVAKGPGAVCTAVDCRNATEREVNATLQSGADHNNNSNNVCRIGSIVRRLTPLECERLQGFPDGWTDIGDWIDTNGKKHKGDADSPRYKALGNSIALPFWAWLARRICAQYDRPMTMASLFDGIGGFPLVFSRAGCTPVWASEIEEFAIAVTKVRFPE